VGFAQWSESRPAGECPRELPAPVQMDVQVVVQAESQPAGASGTDTDGISTSGP